MFIYLFEAHSAFGPRTEEIYFRMQEHGDQLFTSHLALGELLAGTYKRHPHLVASTQESFEALGATILSFDANAANAFGRLRATTSLNSPDAYHLATADTAGMDLFITCDKRLLRIRTPGIKFITDLETGLI